MRASFFPLFTILLCPFGVHSSQANELNCPEFMAGAKVKKASLLKQSEQMTLNETSRFEKNFSMTGFKNYEDFKKALASYSSNAKQLMELLDSGHYEFAMNAPEEARDAIAKSGFQNQRTTGTSQGTYDPEVRDTYESELSGIPYSVYKKMDPALKPHSGYLKPDTASGLEPSTACDYYGTDTYTFKKNNIASRVTYTMGDSGIIAKHVDNSDPEHPVPNNWYGFFIPWKYHDLMIPSLLGSFEKKIGFDPYIVNPNIENDPEFIKLTEAPPKPDGMSYADYWKSKAYLQYQTHLDKIQPQIEAIQDRIDQTSRYAGTSLEVFKDYATNRYIELQLGPIDFDDIETFQFKGQPPSGEFLKKLKRRNITILDGRTQPPSVWTP